MKLPRVPMPESLRSLPLVSVTLAAAWILVALIVGIFFHGELSDADDKLRAVARQVIHQPELKVPSRLLPVAQDLMPGFESNEMFSFLRKQDGDDGGAQERFDARAAAALAQFDGHPTRVLGMVPAFPRVHAFFSHLLIHAGVVHALLTTVIFLLAAPLLERRWGWRVFVPAVMLMTLTGAGAYVLIDPDADRALLGGGGVVAGLVAAVLVRFRAEDVDLLGWLPESASAELVAPAWVLGAAWAVYELTAWLSMPIGVLGLAHSPGFAAHAGGALVGGLAAFAIQHFDWETAPPVPQAQPKAPRPERFELSKIEAMIQAGQGDEALVALEAAVRRNARHRDAVTLYFQMCCERDQPERAAPALAQLVREELRRGAEDVAVARWRDLVEQAPDARLDPATLVRLATIVRQEGDDELAAIALQRVIEAKGVPATIAAEAARVAAGFAPELAAAAARVALADAAIDETLRNELEGLAGGGDADEAKDEDIPVKPSGKDLPPNVFFEGQDRSAFGELDDLSAVPEFPDGAVTEAALRSLDLEGFVAHADDRSEVRVDHDRVRAISVVGVHGLGPKPVLLIDVVVDGSGTERPLSVYRLRSDRFDPRSLIPGSNGGIEALRAVVGSLLAGSEALPLPDAQSAVLRPPKLFDSLAAYEREVLFPLGEQLG